MNASLWKILSIICLSYRAAYPPFLPLKILEPRRIALLQGRTTRRDDTSPAAAVYIYSSSSPKYVFAGQRTLPDVLCLSVSRGLSSRRKKRGCFPSIYGVASFFGLSRDLGRRDEVCWKERKETFIPRNLCICYFLRDVGFKNSGWHEKRVLLIYQLDVSWRKSGK